MIRPLAGITAGLLALAVLSGCGGSDEPAAPATTPPPPVASAVPRPAASGCHTLTHDQALASTEPAGDTSVPCDMSHTAQTYAVGALDTLASGHLLAVDSDRVRAQLATRCPAALYSPMTVSRLLDGVRADTVVPPAGTVMRYQSTSFAVMAAVPAASPLPLRATAVYDAGTAIRLGGTDPHDGVRRSSSRSVASRAAARRGLATGVREKNIARRSDGRGRPRPDR